MNLELRREVGVGGRTRGAIFVRPLNAPGVDEVPRGGCGWRREGESPTLTSKAGQRSAKEMEKDWPW